jgi:RES domain-containing protein
MTLGAWRIVKACHAGGAFSGTAAKTFGGRWNSPGTAVVYLAGSMSLAMLEMLVHLQAHELLKRYVLFEATFDDTLARLVDLKKLPRTWRKSPPSAAVQRIGDEWASGMFSAVLRIPSVIVSTEWNYVLNPAHRDFGKIALGPRKAIQFDPRLIKSLS